MIHTAKYLSPRTHTPTEQQLWSAYLQASFTAQDYEQTHPQDERTPAEQMQLSALQEKADAADFRYTAAIYGEYQAHELRRVGA
jgi:hypothetical protein